MSWILVEPGDVWSFRDGRPLLSGGGYITHSLFPPAPLTVQGAIRSLILGHSDVGWASFREQTTPQARALGQTIGYPASEGREASLGAFAMHGPFLARHEDGTWVRYVPVPADVRRTKQRPPSYFALQPVRGQDFAANWPVDSLQPLWPRQEDGLEVVEEPRWLSEWALDDYLNNLPFSALVADELYNAEPRLGIALDYSQRRPYQGMLYQVEFVRPKDQVGLLVWLSDFVNLPAPQGTMRIGGEGRSAHYRILPDREVKVDAGLGQAVHRFRLVFLTPTFFDGGWQPIDGNAGWSRLLGGPVRLVSAALGRPQRIGGWDIAARGGRGWHKPMRAYVPAGSVYFFEADQALAPPSGPVCQTPPDEDLPLDRLGFGQIAVGAWDWLDQT
jgi:CRISPR-associated protein Cmr3